MIAAEVNPVGGNVSDVDEQIVPPVSAENGKKSAAKRQPITITMVGPPSSGKTHLISTLIGTPASRRDLTFGPDALRDPSISRVVLDGMDDAETNWDQLANHHDVLLWGRDGVDGEATSTVQKYPVRFQYKAPKPPVFGALGQLLREIVGSNPLVTTSLDLDIVDGRGGDLTRSTSNNDQYVAARRAQYISSLRQSRGLVLCLPCIRDQIDNRASSMLLLQVEAALGAKRDEPGSIPLENIAICLTKYEAIFTQYGGSAGRKATDRAEALEHLRNSGLIQILSGLKEQSSAHDLKVEIFPVSTYGFVGGRGAANYYPWKSRPGLLTRVVDEEEYEIYDTGRNVSVDTPGLKDHYPVELVEADAISLWHPFNIAPPLLFAATGRVTGPLHLSIHEVT